MKKSQLLGVSCAAVFTACLSTPSLGGIFDFETLHLRDWDSNDETWRKVTCQNGANNCSVVGSGEPVSFAETEAVYDETLDITWLRDLPGKKNQQDLDIYFNSISQDLGGEFWGLPEIESINSLYYCTLLQTADVHNCGSSTDGLSVNAASLFVGLQTGAAGDPGVYWSSSNDEAGNTWLFRFKDGFEFLFPVTDTDQLHVFAVTDGDVAATPSPTEQLENLISTVISINVASGIPVSNGLDDKLDNALKALEDMNANNDGAALNMLNAFILSVEAQRWILEDAGVNVDDLKAAAQAIIDSLSTN